MKPAPCSVCGGTDLNLIDGFYYCIECGTQDVNAQETIVESTILADGTFAQAATRKINTILKDAVEMSGDWHKWHAFNFMLTGLVDELVVLGAKPSVRMKVLWIWQRYVQKFQERDDSSDAKLPFEEEVNTVDKEAKYYKYYTDKNYSDKYYADKLKKRKEFEMKSAVEEIKFVQKELLLTILYIALNLDKSEIQLYHLLRYVKDGFLSFFTCEKFVPKEIKTKIIPEWVRFITVHKPNSTHSIRKTAKALFRALNLGTPLIPDLRKIIDGFIKELCLPNDLKDLIFSLLNLAPPDYSYVHKNSKRGLLRMPDYEEVAMAYVIVALKMCFGLDNTYEIKLSNAVDRINIEENRLKCYKIGLIDETDRLFSFREWCNFLMFRKTLLCKYYLPMADKYGLEVDDYTLLEQLEARQRRTKDLCDEVTVNLLQKIAGNDPQNIITRDKFPHTLTPMSTYTDVIANHIESQEMKLLLSEDFTLYSLKYALGEEVLSTEESERCVTGVSEENKRINKNIVGNMNFRNADLDLVYVKNCQNKNWLKTKPPRKPHITVINNGDDDDRNRSDADESRININDTVNDSSDNDEGKDNLDEARNYAKDIKNQLNQIRNENNINDSKDNINITNYRNETSNDKKVESNMSDYGYDSNLDSASEVQSKSTITISSTEMINNRKLETIIEEDLDKCIFDDTFTELDNDDVSERISSRLVFEDDIPFDEIDNLNDTQNNLNNTLNNLNDTQNNLNDTQSTTDSGLATPHFNPNNFNRNNVIKELVLAACSKYKIRVPHEFRDNNKERKQRKRKEDTAIADECVKPKRKRLAQSESNREIDKILVDYYTALQSDVINQVSEQVRLAIRNIGDKNDDSVNDTRSLNNFDTALQNNDLNYNDDNENMNENNDIENGDLEEDDESEGENVDDLLSKILPKSDPKFDEKKYDTTQLYLRFKSKFKPDNLIDYEDPELVGIIEKLINHKNTRKSFIEEDKSTDGREQSDSENDNIQENNCEIEENKIMQEIEMQNQEKLKPLVENKKLFMNYKYWTRHYSSYELKKCIDMKERFNNELKEHFPSSFNFVIQECANVLDCTPFTLYKHVQALEEKLIDKT